jgi:hypothetical protein
VARVSTRHHDLWIEISFKSRPGLCGQKSAEVKVIWGQKGKDAM